MFVYRAEFIDSGTIGDRRLVGHAECEVRRSTYGQVVLHRAAALTEIEVGNFILHCFGSQDILSRLVIFRPLLGYIGTGCGTRPDKEDRRKAVRRRVHIERHRRSGVHGEGDIGGERAILIISLC